MKSCPPSVRVVVLQPEPVVRFALREFLSATKGWAVKDTVASVAEARVAVARYKAELVVMDLVGDGREALAFVAECAGARPEVRVVVFSLREDFDAVRDVMKAGGMGFVSKRDRMEDLLVSMVEAMGGGRHMGPHVERVFLQGVAAGSGGEAGVGSTLSLREREVYEGLARGLSIADIARELGRDRKTVETHARRIREKLKEPSLRTLQRRAMLEWAGRCGAKTA